MTDKLSDLIKNSVANREEFTSIQQAYDQSTTAGQQTVTTKQIDCAVADRDLAVRETLYAPRSVIPRRRMMRASTPSRIVIRIATHSTC